uniref:Uncharacterized protein n=1 Tax=Polysiphonia sp. TaxID=1967842 RepID=A0A1Z1MU73_9FLOR|nr:hypothetical protein [Polysiphonia sp.]
MRFVMFFNYKKIQYNYVILYYIIKLIMKKNNLENSLNNYK